MKLRRQGQKILRVDAVVMVLQARFWTLRGGPFSKAFKRLLLIDGAATSSWRPFVALLAEVGEREMTGTPRADLSYRFKRNSREAKVSIGTNYSLYKYDHYTELGLREQVRTYYLNAKYPLSDGFSMNGAYEYEHGIENYQTLRLGMRYDF
jgi:hypothetical protein